ncbi:hypothetical protein ISN75_19345 [Dyella marensis]|uniref:hypothetical protein n=1 Tax=Dyella marensis TaxID=500610 RepID=UPI0031D9DBFC
MEVFPVEIAFKDEAIWLGWVSPEEGHSFFLTSNGLLIFSGDSKEELAREVVKSFPDAQMEVETFFDFNPVFGEFDKNVILKNNFALDAWNLLIDLYYTFDSDGAIFFESSVEVYRRLFSQSEAALMVGVHGVALSKEDMEVVRKVFLEGLELLAKKINVARSVRSH